MTELQRGTGLRADIRSGYQALINEFHIESQVTLKEIVDLTTEVIHIRERLEQLSSMDAKLDRILYQSQMISGQNDALAQKFEAFGRKMGF